jgi:hypothetical protein
VKVAEPKPNPLAQIRLCGVALAAAHGVSAADPLNAG